MSKENGGFVYRHLGDHPKRVPGYPDPPGKGG
jgi:hypothetical protein